VLALPADLVHADLIEIVQPAGIELIGTHTGDDPPDRVPVDPEHPLVSGVRTPRDLTELRDWLPDVHAELIDVLRRLERHYGDMQDVEFTVEEGRLYLLQTRVAKRPAQAAVRFAVDAVAEGLLTREQALLTIDAAALDALLHPSFAPNAPFDVFTTGVAASPGAAKGEIVFSAEEAVAWAERGHRVILVRPFTEADDIHGFFAADGILTAEGGKASHAALVARGMGKPASREPPACTSTSSAANCASATGYCVATTASRSTAPPDGYRPTTSPSPNLR
jgi:pyruvate, orthophosphate dikinase